MFSYSFNFIFHDILQGMGQDISQGYLHTLCIDIDYLFIFHLLYILHIHIVFVAYLCFLLEGSIQDNDDQYIYCDQLLQCQCELLIK